MLEMADFFRGQPIDAIIRNRTSWRRFNGQPLAPEMRTQVETLLAPEAGPFGNTVDIRLVTRKATTGSRPEKLGTYGFISGAREFLVGIVQPTWPNIFEDFGYLMEKIILQATALGLGTCWLGGSFNKSAFARAVALKPDELIPAVVPLGYPTSKRGLRDRFIRAVAGSKNRKPWDELFFDHNPLKPLKKHQAGAFALPIEMVRLAPSASNRQPWRIILSDHSFHFYLQRTPGYTMPFKADLQKVDLGIAMCHFELTARRHRLPGGWIMQKPDLTLPDDWTYIATWRSVADSPTRDG